MTDDKDDIIGAIVKPINLNTDLKFIILIGFIVANIILNIAIIYLLSGTTSVNTTPKAYFNYDDSGYVAGTGSMLPTIDSSSIVYYVNNFSLYVNSIYIYEQPGTGSRILHRLVYIDGDWCFFKGDNNVYQDPKVNCTTVKQKVKAIEYP